MSGAQSRAVVADLTLVFQFLEGFENLVLFDGLNARVVQLVEVNVVGLQPSQGLLAGEAYELRLELLRPLLVADARRGLVVDVIAELGGDDHLVPAMAHELGEDFLAVTVAVGVGGVEEVDAQLERLFEQLAARLLGDAAPPVGGYGPNAEADLR